MRQLIWKELREQRFVPLIYGAFTIAVVVAWYVASVVFGHYHHDPGEVLTAKEMPEAMVALLCCAGVISGSGAISPELGKGTMSFLSLLPGGRARVWRAKVTAGLVIVGLSALAIFTAYCAVTFVVFGKAGMKPLFADFPATQYHVLVAVLFATCTLLSYAVCLLASTVVDRVIVAATIGLVAGAGLLASVVMWINSLGMIYETIAPGVPMWSSVVYTFVVSLFSSAICFVASYAGFCSGQALGTQLRVRRALGIAGAGLASLVVFMAFVDNSANEAVERKALEVRSTVPANVNRSVR